MMYLLCTYIVRTAITISRNVVVICFLRAIPPVCSQILSIASLTHGGSYRARNHRGMDVQAEYSGIGGSQRACAMHTAYMNGSSYYTRSSLNRFRNSVLHLLPNLLSGTPLALDTDLADISNSCPSAVARRARPRKLTSIPPSNKLTLRQRLVFLPLPTLFFLFTLPIPIPAPGSSTSLRGCCLRLSR
jgi:hypothetical protein